MAGIEYVMTVNNKDLVKALTDEVEAKTLEEWGILAEGYAIEYCPKDTGNLSNSISHKAMPPEHCVEVGTDVKYGIYQEYGTGKYATGEGGSHAKKIPWYYQDEDGVWHRTSGNKPHPFIRPAITDHVDEYRDILLDNCLNA